MQEITIEITKSNGEFAYFRTEATDHIVIDLDDDLVYSLVSSTGRKLDDGTER